MKYLWIVSAIVIGGAWSLLSIIDIIITWSIKSYLKRPIDRIFSTFDELDNLTVIWILATLIIPNAISIYLFLK